MNSILKQEVKMNPTLLLSFLEEVIASASDQEKIRLTIEDNADTVPGWDSLVTVSIAAALNEEYNIQLTIDDFDKLTSVKSILEIVSK
jgi:acyl carrier protein